MIGLAGDGTSHPTWSSVKDFSLIVTQALLRGTVCCTCVLRTRCFAVLTKAGIPGRWPEEARVGFARLVDACGHVVLFTLTSGLGRPRDSHG